MAAVLAPPAASRGWRRSALLTLSDIIITTVSFYLGFLIRFEGHVPPERIDQYWHYLPVLLILRVGINLGFQLNRWSFRLSGLHEALRIAQASLLGSALFTAVLFFIQRAAENVSLGPPRSVIVIEFLLTTALLTTSRFSLRIAGAWGVSTHRPRAGGWVRTIIVGAGNAGDLLLRDLQRSDEHSYAVVGFVDDAQAKRGAMIGGRQVLGSLDDLPQICRRWRVAQLLFAIPRLPPERLRQILDACSDLKLTYKIIPVSYAYLNDREAASRLQSLEAEDLLIRRPVRFAAEEVRPHIEGKRILVTGAAGSIGSEICRQVAACAPESLVLADINENDLYLLYRALDRLHRGPALVPEIVDIRDAARMHQLGETHRPQLILHAAAHKHVPLMENAPEEAVKNNLAGCRNVMAMADAVDAERFVFISTDKAVEPASVMGATKQLAEQLVRHYHRASSTLFNVVRFGNVLGSAGSLVPLFKQQIAHGGPVTVTDRECTRFLMTTREAVGLTLAAGLVGEGGLFVLDMGEPIRILDLARLMITLSGYVPDREIQIVFTGLRPGEKLSEKLMTEAEAAGARHFREGVLTVEGVSPPSDIEDQLEGLARAAELGDRSRVVELLRLAVPGYQPVEWPVDQARGAESRGEAMGRALGRSSAGSARSSA